VTLLSRLRNQYTTVTPVGNTTDLYTTLPSFFRGFSRAGVDVSRDRALRHAAVWACVRLRAETIGSLPIDVVEYEGPQRKVLDSPTWLQRPNPETTRFELFERTSASIDTDGNAFWWIERDNLGRVREVWVLPPTAVRVDRDRDANGAPNGPKQYEVAREKVDPADILHIPGFTLPGRLRGLSPIEQHQHAIGLAVAAEEYGETFFGNGATMSGVIEAEKDPGEDKAERMRATFARDHQGLDNAHKPGFLFGAKWTQLSIPNEQAQFLETRKHQVREIARIFRVPPHKIGDLDQATFSNIEHQAIEWVQDGLLPYTGRIETAIDAAGLLDQGQRLKFNFNALLRGDVVSRYAAYAIGRQWGWLSADDVLSLEDRNPLPNGIGQTYLEPMNMIPAGDARAQAFVAKALHAADVDRDTIAALTGVQYEPQEEPTS